MVVKTNAVDALLQTSRLAEPTSARFLKKIIARIDTVSAHYQAPLTKRYPSPSPRAAVLSDGTTQRV